MCVCVCVCLCVCVCVGKWMTRFSQTGKMQNFQLDGEAPVSIPMMQQENYPVKMGIDSDLSCTVSSSLQALCMCMCVCVCLFVCMCLYSHSMGFLDRKSVV